MTTTQPPGRFSGRTKLITIASIVAVAAAGAFAVSANIGILNASGNTKLGTLSAAGDLAPPNSQVVDVYIDGNGATATTTTVTGAGSTGAGSVAAGAVSAVGADSAAGASATAAPRIQQFAVDVAGTVAITTTDAGIRLEGVSPAAGWTWTTAQDQPTTLTVTMTDGIRTLEFTGTLGADGTVSANVNEPIVTPNPTNTTPSKSGHSTGGDDKSYEGGGDDD